MRLLTISCSAILVARVPALLVSILPALLVAFFLVVEPAVDLDNPQSKNQRYDKRDFVARKHVKEREPWVQKPMPFPPKVTKKKDEEEFERFAKILRLVFLRTRLTDILKMPP